MNDSPLLTVIRMQIRSAKACLAATHASLTAFEEMLDLQVQEEGTEPEPPAPSFAPATPPSPTQSEGPMPLGAVLPGDCVHPKNKRTRAAVMGYPNRFVCQECGETVDSE